MTEPRDDKNPSRKAEDLLTDRGVFIGEHGLRGLAKADEFWEKQDYGTRLYYGPKNFDYLHRQVLQSAVEALDEAAKVTLSSMPQAQPTAEDAFRRIERALLPDPHDEREISIDWLRQQIRSAIAASRLSALSGQRVRVSEDVLEEAKSILLNYAGTNFELSAQSMARELLRLSEELK